MKFIHVLAILTFVSSTTLMAGFAATDKLVQEAREVAGEMPASILKKMIDNEEAIVLLDIRDADQRTGGEIYADETYVLSRGKLEFEIANLIKDKSTVIVTYCIAGNSSALAAYTLRRLGYKNATTLKNGMKAWAKAGYPIEIGFGSAIFNNEE